MIIGLLLFSETKKMIILKKYIYLILIFSLSLIAIAVLLHLKHIQRINYEEKLNNDLNEPWPSILHYDSIPAPYKNDIKRTTILNTLVEKFNYQSYLEIGQGKSNENFHWINCPIKIGVDPDISLNATYQMTSDEFFPQNEDFFDLIFVDELHHADQTERDILNSLRVLNENGTIVVHDCNPTTEAIQIVPQQTSCWTGDVWKAWVKLRATRPDLKMYVIDTDFGCGIIRKGSQKIINIPGELTYKMLEKYRKEFLNLVDIDDFLRDLNNSG